MLYEPRVQLSVSLNCQTSALRRLGAVVLNARFELRTSGGVFDHDIGAGHNRTRLIGYAPESDEVELIWP
jgi:hypothetical protein